MSFPSKLFTLALCILATGAQAHEFWIEPEDYAVDPGAPITATFRNGENFAGSSLSYIPNRSVRFDMAQGGDAEPVPARIGDNPALSLPEGLDDGLLIVVQATTDQSLTYSEWEKWLTFTTHKAATDIPQAHLDRGLPQEGFDEAYRRYAKTLIAVGDGAGSDRNMGLFTEIVLGANPYTDDLSGGLPAQVLLDGAPKAGAQVEMFAKDADGVEITLHTADADGRVTLPVVPGTDYLLDSVAFAPLEPEAEGDAVWLTHWAALTFHVPEG